MPTSGEASLIGGGSGGYLHLDDASNAYAISNPVISFTGGSPTINFKSPGAGGSLSILQIGLMALVALFILREA